jgi:HlyD family secretion protein
MKINSLRLLALAAATAAFLLLSGCGQGGVLGHGGLAGEGSSGRSPAQTAEGQPSSKAAGSRPGGSREAAGRQPGAGVGPIPVQAADVRLGALTAEDTTAGSLVPVMQSPVAAQVAGVVARVVRDAGDWVKTGQIVVQLDDTELDLAVQNAEANLENARISYEAGRDTVSGSNPKLQLQVQAVQSALAAAQKNYDAQNALFDLGGTSAAALDSARSQLQQAKANLQAAQTALEENQNSGSRSLAQLELAVQQAANQLEAARINLGNAAVRAPFDGQIAAVNVNPGMYVSQNTSAFLLVSADRQVSFSVPPADAANLPAGSTVRFTYGGRQYQARISHAPSAPINGVVPMVAAIPGSSNLPFGAVGTVGYSLTLAEGALIQMSALGASEDRNFVYTIVDGKAVMQDVTILGQNGADAAVEGLQAGAQVILNPPPGLLTGSAVRIVGAQAAGTAGQASAGGSALAALPNAKAPGQQRPPASQRPSGPGQAPQEAAAGAGGQGPESGQ